MLPFWYPSAGKAVPVTGFLLHTRIAAKLKEVADFSTVAISPITLSELDHRTLRRKFLRPRTSFTKNAIQKQTAIAAMMMNLRGETSKDVSEMIRPKANPLIIIASCNSQIGPASRRLIRSRVFSSCAGGSGTGGIGIAPPLSFSDVATSGSWLRNSSTSLRLSAVASPLEYRTYKSEMMSRVTFCTEKSFPAVRL